MQAKKQAKIYVVEGGRYGIYQNLWLKVESLTDTYIDFTISVDTAIYEKRVLVLNGVCELMLPAELFDTVKANSLEVLPLSLEDVQVFHAVEITYTADSTPGSILFDLIDSFVSTDLVQNAKAFLTTQKRGQIDNRFEQGLYYYSEKNITRKTENETDTLLMGAAGGINYISLRNQSSETAFAELRPFALDISASGTVTLSGFESGTLADVSIGNSDFVGTGSTITAVGSDTITITGTLFSGLILRNVSNVVLFEIEFSSLMTQYNANKRIGYCYKNRLPLYADGGDWVASDLVLNHQKKYLNYGGVVVNAGGQLLAYMANNWDTTNQYLTIDNFDILATDADRLGLWKQITTTDGLVSKVTNEWIGADIAVPISVLSGNTLASISNFSPNWNTARTDPSGSVSLTSLFYSATKTNLTTYGIYRLVFDIDTLGGQQLTSGSITLTKPASAINSDSAYLYALTRDTPGTTGANDYDNFGAKLSDMAIYDTVNESITFVLNAMGLAYVNGGSVSFMVRDWEDADDTAPTEQTNTFQNFTTFVTDFYKAAALIDFEQATAANQPIYGTDKTGEYTAKAENLALTGVLVDSWGNAAPNTARDLPTMTGSGATRPSWNSGTNSVDFTNGKALSATAVSTISMNQFTVTRYFKSVSGLAQNANYQDTFIRFGLGSGSNAWMGIQAGQNSASVIVFINIGGASITKTYTYAQINALLAAGYMLSATYLNGAVSFFENGVLVGSTTTTATLSIAQRTGVTSSFVAGIVSEMTLNVYPTALTAFEVAILYANRDNYDYQLPKFGIVATGASIMYSNFLANQTVSAFSTGIWVYMQSTRTTAGVATFIGNNLFSDNPDKGFSLGQNVSAGLTYIFRWRCSDGVNSWGSASPQLSKSAFDALYLNRWVFVCGVFDNGRTDLYVDGVLIDSDTGAAGSIIMPTAGLVAIMGKLSTAEMRAGNKLARPFVLTRALSASEVYDLHLDYYVKNQHYSVDPRAWIEGSGNVALSELDYQELTFSEIEENAVNIVYADDPTDNNIIQFTYAGIVFGLWEGTFAAMAQLTELGIENGQTFEISEICGKLHTSAVKFKNRFGVWDYVLFTGNESHDVKPSGGGYGQFETADYAFGGKYNQKTSLSVLIASENAGTVDDLRKNKNVWFAKDWQFSDFYSILTEEGNLDTALQADERVLRFEVSGVSALELGKRFKVGDRVTFEQLDVPFEMSAIWGEIIRIEDGLAVVRFFETTENMGVSLIDTWVTNATQVRICAFDAWELVQLVDVSSYSVNDGFIQLQVEINGQAFDGYEF